MLNSSKSQAGDNGREKKLGPGCVVDYCIGGRWGKSQVLASLQPTPSYYDYCYG